ncbi:MAG: SDR family NAD(P)-dependent oxidoreductase [Alphaproteobacteria bacterium]
MGVMVVTGAGRGIGAAIARIAAREGWDVAINFNRSKDKAEAVATQLRAAGRRAVTVRADMGDEAQILRLFETVDRELGPIESLVNNAAIDHETLIADAALADVHRVFAVNIFGPMIAAREAVRRMSTARGGQGGVIVNISSISARYGGLPKDVIYAASKGALDSFSLGLAREVGREGIRVVSVRPGITATEIFDHVTGGLDRAKAVAERDTVLGRICAPEEVAELAVWLCSPAASYVTCAAWDVSAGR